MNERLVGAVSGAIGILGVLVQVVPGYVIGAWADGGASISLPTFGTIGRTVMVYSLLNSIVSPLVILVLGVSLGYYVGRRIDLPRSYRRLVGTVVAGSTVGIAVLATVASAYSAYTGPFTSVNGFTVFGVVAVFLRFTVTVSLVVALGALAGATFAHFEDSGTPPSRTDESDARVPAAEPDESPPDDAEIQSQPS